MNSTPATPAAVNGHRRFRREDGIFFHADDMGATPRVTARLCEAWERGLVDSFSIFGDCDHPETIAVRLQARPDLPARISVHLNLWEGRPLTVAAGVTRLVDRSGNFNAEFLAMLASCHVGGSTRGRDELLAQVEREWRAQIENVLGMIAARPLKALDGHIHVHMVPTLFRLAVKLAREYGIPEVRNVREPFHLSRNIRECLTKRFLSNCLKRQVLSACGKLDTDIAAKAELRSPDGMLGVLYSGMMSRANIVSGIAAARRHGAKRIEVLVHIGRAEPSEIGRWNGSPRKAAFVLSPSRDAEFEELIRLRRPRSLAAPDRLAS
ncbi:MAG TPA: ChbG/HpnK family deacetylase [Candidatus Sulfomarinibacteraceae bacterium]|nr:ChbG/HpnK family deacetylase [Candidatus Sulfomarinibacteraceae bacterium]